MTPWTAKDTRLMIREKKKDPHMPWEKVSQLLNYRHTPSACSRKFRPFAVSKYIRISNMFIYNNSIIYIYIYQLSHPIIFY